MAKHFAKKQSKRISARKRYKIEKKVKEHNRKVRKEKRKNPTKKKKKDPGIPNNLPFKEKILKEAEDRKIRAQEEQQRLKEKRKKEREKVLAQKRNLDNVLKDALKKQKDFEKKKSETNSEKGPHTGGKAVENSLKTFYKEFKKVVDAADVVLEVLDARDPLGSRCSEVEQLVLSSGTNKRLVLVLNKIDLVPRENVEAWLTHLKNEFPTVPFKASRQSQRGNLARTKANIATASEDLLRSSHCLGADILMKLLGNYCRNQDITTNIRVGVVGFPNTGKSSIINSLKRSKACNVGATPGVTKAMQEVQLDKHIKLLDSPGVVMAQAGTDTATVLRNVVKLETLPDLIQPVQAILKRCNKQQMMSHYCLPDYKGADEFLALLAKRFGKLKKGGIPNVNKAARALLKDWMTGRISYFTHPPEQTTLPTHLSASIVTEMGKAFNIEDLQQEETKILTSLKTVSNKHMLIESLGPLKGIVNEADLPVEQMGDDNNEDEDEEDDKEMKEDDESEIEESEDEEDMEDSEEEEAEDEDKSAELKDVTVSLPDRKTSARGSAVSINIKNPELKSEFKGQPEIVQQNKARKKDFKKMKKDRKRGDIVATQLSDAFTSAFASNSGSDSGNDEDYNFSTDFI